MECVQEGWILHLVRADLQVGYGGGAANCTAGTDSAGSDTSPGRGRVRYTYA